MKLSSRRHFFKRLVKIFAAVSSPGVISACAGPAIIRNIAEQDLGIASGDVSTNAATIWSRTDRLSRLTLEYASNPSFRSSQFLKGQIANPNNGFTARVLLDHLPQGERVFYRVFFSDSEDKPIILAGEGEFTTGARQLRDIKFLWSGDTAGQGWGINPRWGGMQIFNTMAKTYPDFFIHCGDHVYADVPLEQQKITPSGEPWINLITEAKTKVAETIEEFRGNFSYNWLDNPFKSFHRQVPLIALWDDHEVIDNWYPGEHLMDDRYVETSIDKLASRAKQAFVEYMPIDPRHQRLYRKIPYGPLLDVFTLDLRSYRGSNNPEQQAGTYPNRALMGSSQLQWLRSALSNSKATWKVIASDMPIGLIVYDDWRTQAGMDGFAYKNGEASGRELEMVELLRFIKREKIPNIIWLTADVHYTAAHYYDPEKAQFNDFNGFWEFVSGPLNAGTFGPSALDNTFGPQVVFQKVPQPGSFNLPPSSGLQFFGEVFIDGQTRQLQVTLKDIAGKNLFRQTIDPS